jgi:hypothetical protein
MIPRCRSKAWRRRLRARTGVSFVGLSVSMAMMIERTYRHLHLVQAVFSHDKRRLKRLSKQLGGRAIRTWGLLVTS